MLISCIGLLSSCDKAKTIACPACGEENQDTVKFCFNCGSEINNNGDKTTQQHKEKIDILKDYLKENGDLQDYAKYGYSGDYEVYGIKYDSKLDDIIFYCYLIEDVSESDIKNDNYDYNDYQRTTKIYLDFKSQYSKVDWYYYITDNSTYWAEANIDKHVFSKSNDTLKDMDIHVDYSKFYDIVEDLFKGDVSSTLTYIDALLEKTDIEIDLSDLGFLNY